MPIVIDPNKQVTDPTLLSALAKQGIDYRYVELYQDYALAQGVKGKSPYAKFYRHTETSKRWMVVSQLPMVNADGVKVQVGWDKVEAKFVSKVNQFQADVSNKTVTITCINDQPTGAKKGNTLAYTPQLYLDGVEQTCGKATLHAIDPTNENYQNNVLEWDYGICKRRLRLIEGMLLGTWVFATNPLGDVRVKYNQSGAFKLRLGQFKVNDDEEIIPKEVFDKPEKFGLFGYPLTIGDSSTFYPDADPETNSVDGRVRRRTEGSGAAWSTLRNGAGTAAYDAETASTAFVICGYSGYSPNYWYHLDRMLALFYTEGLPDDASITQVIASVYGNSKVDPQSWTPNLNVYASTPASNTGLVAADYSQVGTTPYCDTPITYAGFSVTGYNDFTLNAAGIAAISKTGVTKLGFRNANYDVADVAPSNPTADRIAYLGCYFAEQGNGYKPKLVVTYTSGTFQLSITDGFKGGDTPTRLMTASVSVTEGLKGGDSFDKTALMSLLAIDGLKSGDTPALLAQMLPVLSEGIKLGESLSIQLGTLQQSFYPITPVEVTPGTAGSWQDVDVSAYVPAGATGVILHCVNNSTNTMRYFGFRKNGSTDARTDSLSYGTHVWATIGVDSSRIFEAYIQDITDIDVWLVGYTTSGVTFFTNAYDKSPSVLSNWEDIDCSTEAPNAIGLIFEIQNTGSLASFGLRKYGSSDNRVVQTVGYNTFAVIIGCDTAQKCQGQIADSNIKVYLVGYVTQGAIFNTNATDVSLSSTGSWIDLAALPTGSVMGFIEATSLASTNRFGLRKNGSSEAIYKYCYRHPFAMVECDSSGIIEGEISNTDVDFFLVGYAVSSLVLIITLTDGLKAGESFSLNVVMPKTLADGFKVGDSSVLNILRYLALTDGLKLGDSALTVIVKLLLLLDGLKAGDTIAVAMTAGKTLTDGLKLGDLPTELSQAWLSLAEGGKFGDSEIINLIGVMYYLTLADGLKLGDSTLRTLTALLQLVDGFKLGDVPLYSTIGELLMAWALAQHYYYVTTEVKPYFQITTEAKSYFEITTRTGVE